MERRTVPSATRMGFAATERQTVQKFSYLHCARGGLTHCTTDDRFRAVVRGGWRTLSTAWNSPCPNPMIRSRLPSPRYRSGRSRIAAAQTGFRPVRRRRGGRLPAAGSVARRRVRRSGIGLARGSPRRDTSPWGIVVGLFLGPACQSTLRSAPRRPLARGPKRPSASCP